MAKVWGGLSINTHEHQLGQESKSTITQRGTCLPAPVSEKNLPRVPGARQHRRWLPKGWQ